MVLVRAATSPEPKDFSQEIVYTEISVGSAQKGKHHQNQQCSDDGLFIDALAQTFAQFAGIGFLLEE